MPLQSLYERSTSRSRSRSRSSSSNSPPETCRPSCGSSSSQGSQTNAGSDSDNPDDRGPQTLRWLKAWCEALPHLARGLEEFRAKLGRQLVLGTACSGTGAPSKALSELVEGNMVEVVSSEKHAPTRQFFLVNNSVRHCWTDMVFARLGGHCDVHKGFCAALPLPGEEDYVDLDIYVAGFVCKQFSGESPERFKHVDIPSMFRTAAGIAPNVVPFVETSRYISIYRPKTVILENVTGCLKTLPGTLATNDYKAVKAKQLYDKMKKEHGLQNLSEAQYRQYSSSCRTRYGAAWCKGLSPREVEGLDLLYCIMSEHERNTTIVDIVKSLDRRVLRRDGLSPTLVTNSKIYDFRNDVLLGPAHLLMLHGFDVQDLEFPAGLRTSVYRMMAGNAMSVPVIGAVLFGLLLTANFNGAQEG